VLIGETRRAQNQAVDKRVLFLLLAAFVSLPAVAQLEPQVLVTQPISQNRLITLRGTVSPLAQARYDRGIVNESTPAQRLLLVLNRPPEREAAFQQYLKDLHTPGSPNYHHWLTPDQIGSRFGPGDADIDAVVNWLSGSGFRINRLSRARRFVEFSGNVGQINAAFHTEIHQYMVDGVLHHANATAIRIPQALSGIVAGLSPLSDSWPTPQFEEAGKGHYDASAHQFVPDFNLPSNWSPLLYGVVPADFYMQYNLNPLYSANVTGSGVTIGIIDESNIDLDVANAYRTVFGLKANQLQVVLDGGDPGANSSQIESYLDVELAGAVAPAATINLYLSAGSPYQDPLVLAALRAVEDDHADILSISWGAAEQDLGVSGNQFWNALWEEAAAQGQTVLVSSGDTGQVPNQEYFFQGMRVGPAVSGLASSPWDIAVGGTDFYYADYAAGAPSASTFWNSSNDPATKGSLKAPITEQVWNDPFGLDAISNGVQRNEFGASGGGASSCIVLDSSNACVSGYAKPGWQSGPGVPADNVRDIPDVSLFASNGANYSGWAICDYEGSCAPDAGGNFGFDIVGGTSASAPAMAGIMALVVQKYGRQGQADTVLYPLSQQKPSAFHDITLGGNWDLCVQGDNDCTLNVAGLGAQAGESTVYSAGPGYDQASGLGSVDATQLVNNWNAISFASTTTTLQVSPSTAVHGTNVTLNASVLSSSGSGTPTGAVSILTNSTSPSNQSQTAITLSGGSGSSSLNYLPGGTYQLTAQYSGDGVYAGSKSQPQTIKITPEKSALTLNIQGYGGTKAANLAYGVPVILTAQPVGVNSPAGSPDGAATGSMTFTLDGNTATAPLNVGGMASWTAPGLAVGTHTASASYPGDASFQASSAQAQTFSVGKGDPWIDFNVSNSLYNTIYAGSSISVSIIVGTVNGPMFSNTGPAPPGIVAPTGTVTVKLVWDNSNVLGIGCAADTTGLAQTATLVPATGQFAQYATAEVVLANIPARDNGYGYMLCAQYNGDTNWIATGIVYLNYISVALPPAAQSASTTSLSITPTNVAIGQRATITATVTGPEGATIAPTGYVTFFDNGAATNWLYLEELTPAASGASSSYTLSLPSQYFWTNGANQITAVYSGDSNYAVSTSNAVTVNVNQGGNDFTLSAQSPQLLVASGSTGTVGLSLGSVNNFSGSVALTCTPSSSQFSCSLSPSSTALNGTASATLSVTAMLPGTTASLSHGPQQRHGWLGGGAAIAICFLVFLPLRMRRHIGLLFLPLLVGAFLLTSCGGHGSGNGSNPTPVNGTPPGTYTVLVGATSNGIVHNAVVNVVVH
jgi:subtilase family serine protease